MVDSLNHIDQALRAVLGDDIHVDPPFIWGQGELAPRTYHVSQRGKLDGEICLSTSFISDILRGFLPINQVFSNDNFRSFLKQLPGNTLHLASKFSITTREIGGTSTHAKPYCVISSFR